MQKFRPVVLILMATILVVAFQNCFLEMGKPAIYKGTELNSSGGTGNGEGYDGKSFVRFANGVCADGGRIDSQIEFINGSPFLTRENCVDLIPPRAVSVTFVPGDTSLIYLDGVLYTEFKTPFSDMSVKPDGEIYLSSQGFQDSVPNLVAKTDANGRILWSFGMYPTEPDVHLYTRSIATLSGGEALISGSYGVYEGLIAKLNSSGTAVFTKALVRTAAVVEEGIGGTDVARVAARTDGGFYACGDRFVARFGAGGEILWQYSFQEAGHLRALQIVENGSVIATGDSLILKLDADGNLLWSRKFDPSVLIMLNIAKAEGGEVVLTGFEIGAKPFIVRVAADGSLVWARRFQSSFPEGYFGIVSRPDGSLLVAGGRTLGTRNLLETLSTGMVVSLSGAGELQWSFSHKIDSCDRYDRIALRDGKIWISGMAGRPGELCMSASRFYSGIILAFKDQSIQSGCSRCSQITDLTIAPAADINLVSAVLTAGPPRFTVEDRAIRLTPQRPY